MLLRIRRFKVWEQDLGGWSFWINLCWTPSFSVFFWSKWYPCIPSHYHLISLLWHLLSYVFQFLQKPFDLNASLTTSSSIVNELTSKTYTVTPNAYFLHGCSWEQKGYREEMGWVDLNLDWWHRYAQNPNAPFVLNHWHRLTWSCTSDINGTGQRWFIVVVEDLSSCGGWGLIHLQQPLSMGCNVVHSSTASLPHKGLVCIELFFLWTR